MKKIGSNMYEEMIGSKKVLFSYTTPVACYDYADSCFYKTEKRWSSTTSRHISKFYSMTSGVIEIKPQEFFDRLVLK